MLVGVNELSLSFMPVRSISRGSVANTLGGKPRVFLHQRYRQHQVVDVREPNQPRAHVGIELAFAAIARVAKLVELVARALQRPGRFLQDVARARHLHLRTVLAEFLDAQQITHDIHRARPSTSTRSWSTRTNATKARARDERRFVMLLAGRVGG